MMSSVIPARLQFQCGHAALVTLPRVKGESAAQRNDRVAREKTAALARQCDFCAPSVAILEPQVAAVNGSHAEVIVSEVVDPSVVAELVVVVADEPSETEPTRQEPDVERVVVPTDAVADVVVVEPEASEPELPHEPVVEAIIESHAELAPAPEPKPARTPRARRPTAPAAPKAAPPKPARAHRTPARRVTSRHVPVASGQRFLVEYQAERVVRAATIQDVLRQVTGPGAALDVVAIIRQD
jgi:hypothetical protein